MQNPSTDRAPAAAVAWHSLAVERVAAELASDPVSGLTSTEAQRRLESEGLNQIVQTATVSRLVILARQFTSLVVWILIAAAVVSALLGDTIDALAILAIILLNGAIGFFQEYRAENAVAELKRMTAPKTRVIRDGGASTIQVSSLVPGDLILLEAGDLVGADARLIETAGLQANEASLTGESSPVGKSIAECAASTPLAERTNLVFLGTAVTRGSGRALVVTTGMRTEFGRIAELLQEASSDETPLQRRLDRVAHYLLWFCLGIVVLLFALGLSRSVPLFELFLGAVSLAVAAIPEGLPAIVTVSLALGVSRMARRNALVRRLPSVETLGCAQVICTDKTGTLTVGEMTARRIVTADRVFTVTGEGYSTEGAIFDDGDNQVTADPALTELLRTLVACNDAHLTSQAGKPSIVGDPTEGALLVVAAKAGITAQAIDNEMPKIETIPFTSERRIMTVVRKLNGGACAFVKGAPEVVMERCAFIRTADGVREIDEQERARMLEANTLLAGEALRVLACAQRPMESVDRDDDEIESKLTFLGLVGMQDPPRAEAQESIRRCRVAGIRVVMITGDHPRTASAIGRALGILRPHDEVLTGADLESMPDAELSRRVEQISVYARVTAEHKLRIIRAWKARGAVVAMTGDGVNDAPALKEAAIGVAMGITGTEVTKQAADIVITDDNFATIVAAVEEGRGIYDNISKTLLYLMGGNSGELFVMMAAAVLGWPLPLLPTQLLWINLVTDGLPALALATDSIQEDVLSQPPRNPQAQIIDRRFLGRMALTGVLTAGVSLAAFAYALHYRLDVAHARNLCFFVLVVAELMRSFGVRSATRSIWQVGLLSNLRLLAIVAASFVLQLGISVTPVLERIFETQRITLSECIVAIAIGAFPATVLEIMKAVRRRRLATSA
jgi:P-type Ca2+ transporter type 2C